MDDAQQHVLFVNARRFEVKVSRLQGVQIRALAGVPPDQVLIVEEAATEDRVLRDDDFVSLDAGPVRVYSKPPTTFGCLGRPPGSAT